LNLFDMLEHPDPRIREAGEIYKKAIEEGRYRVHKPFYDSPSKWNNFKSWCRYLKSVGALEFSRLIHGKKRKVVDYRPKKRMKQQQ
jgi:hypothetical protein